MIKEAIEKIESMSCKMDSHIIHQDQDLIEVIIPTEEGTGMKRETIRINRKPNPRNHQFTSTDGFLSYLASDKCADDRGIIFVSRDNISARLKYQAVDPECATLPLVESEEMKAIRTVAAGVSQKELWRLLNTKLFGCISSELLLGIATIKLSSKTEAEIVIDEVGQAEMKGSDGTAISWHCGKANDGTHRTVIKNRWEWKGRIWECFDEEFAIQLVLEVEPEGPRFILHPQRLETVLREARLNLVETIGQSIMPQRFTIHEGSY